MDVFAVVAEPNRRAILGLLNERERSVGDLAEALGLSQPTVSKHLMVLRSSRFVSVTADAQRRVYCLRDEPLRQLDTWIEPFRATWANRLDRLASHLDEMEDS